MNNTIFKLPILGEFFNQFEVVIEDNSFIVSHYYDKELVISIRFNNTFYFLKSLFLLGRENELNNFKMDTLMELNDSRLISQNKTNVRLNNYHHYTYWFDSTIIEAFAENVVIELNEKVLEKMIEDCSYE